jgi:hypothetical protein
VCYERIDSLSTPFPPIDMMRHLDLATIFLLSSISSGNAFTASLRWERQSCVALFSSTNSDQAVATRVVTDTVESVSAADLDIDIADIFPMTVIKNKAVQMSAGEINTRLENQLSKMKAKDQTSHQLLREVCLFRSKDAVMNTSSKGMILTHTIFLPPN